METEISNEDGHLAVDPFKIITSQALVCFSFSSSFSESIFILLYATWAFNAVLKGIDFVLSDEHNPLFGCRR